MKPSRARTLVLGAIAAIGLVAGAIAAIAIPGPDPTHPSSTFSLIVNETTGGQGPIRYDETIYTWADGWDFGDRYAYSCAFVEHFTAAALDFEVHEELFADYLSHVAAGHGAEVNDRGGPEGPEGAHPCGDNLVVGDGILDGPAASLIYDPAIHGDHFPHGDATGAADIVFFRDDDGDGTFSEFARIDYSHGDPCDSSYWTPGNSAGQAVLWWDPDGPSSADGHTSLGCPGTGPGEPFAVALVDVHAAGAGVAYCTLDPLNGDLCAGFPPPPPTGPTGATGPTSPALECFAGQLASEVDGHLETFRVCRQ